MQLFSEELALANLKGEIAKGERGYMSKEDAYKRLKEMSGEDFGMDIELWETWVSLLDYPKKLSEKKHNKR